MRHSAYFIAFLLLALACRSPFNKKEPVFTGDNTAFFRLSSDVYPVEEIRKELPPQTAYPELSEDVLNRLLASLVYNRETVWGRTTRRVFYNEQLGHISQRLREVFQKLDERQRLVIVSRHDPDNSVLSHMERTTLLVWFDEAGLNVVLGEIRQELPHNDILERQDWLNVLPVSMKRAYNDLSLAPGPYQLKVVRGFTHNTWAVFPLDRLEALPPVPPNNRVKGEDKPSEDKKPEPAPDKGEPRQPEKQPDARPDRPDTKPAEDRSGAPVETPSSPALNQRLTELKQALEQGLITQAEYEAKRKAILDQH